MVEQRNSFPQAVPSSICVTCHVSMDSLQSQPSRKASSQGSREQHPPEPRGSFARRSVCSGRETYVVAGEVVDSGLGQHAVVCVVLAAVAFLRGLDETYTRAQTS